MSKSWDGASTSKDFTNSAGIDKNYERKVAFTHKPLESRSKDESKLTEEGYHKRRRINASIYCGEIVHKFSECTLTKP